MMYGWDYNNGGYGFMGFLFMMLMMVFVIVGVVALVRYLSHDASGRSKDDALAVLRRRYASGEIDKKEFDEKKKDLA